jgi:hypothetical protein
MRIILCVTRRAVHGRTFEDTIDMTAGTGGGGVFTIQMECKLRVVDLRRFPTIRCMTGSTLCTKRTCMSIVLGMAGGAIHRRAFEDTVNMATRTDYVGMFAIQMEREFRVVHFGRFPRFG